MTRAIKFVLNFYDHNMVFNDPRAWVTQHRLAIAKMPLRSSDEIDAWSKAWVKLMMTLRTGNPNDAKV